MTKRKRTNKNLKKCDRIGKEILGWSREKLIEKWVQILREDYAEEEARLKGHRNPKTDPLTDFRLKQFRNIDINKLKD